MHIKIKILPQIKVVNEIQVEVSGIICFSCIRFVNYNITNIHYFPSSNVKSNLNFITFIEKYLKYFSLELSTSWKHNLKVEI